MKLNQKLEKIDEILVPMKREFLSDFKPYANDNKDPIRKFIKILHEKVGDFVVELYKRYEGD